MIIIERPYIQNPASQGDNPTMPRHKWLHRSSLAPQPPGGSSVLPSVLGGLGAALADVGQIFKTAILHLQS